MGARILRFKNEHPFLLGGILWVLVAAATLTAGAILVHTTLFLGFDRFFYELLSTHPNRTVDALVKPVNLNFLPFGVTPSYLNIWIVLLLAYLAIWRRDTFTRGLISVVAAFAMSLVILYLNTKFVFRTRPFVVFPNIVGPQLRAYLLHVTSWPSGHTRDSAIMAVLTSRYIPKLKWPAAIFGVFVAFSRVYIGGHYPTDVIGGLLLGWAIGSLALFLADSAVESHGRGKQHVDTSVPETDSDAIQT